ncbi:hypothetical protein HII31_12893 [Pseudocercospora fuligena]|uniref:Uncharacterized protein n=1 Tax=Pseudocercospora fuligena TaxID=685502 RepID=A0A8H6R4J7_9PEZI|nr:hypothetical protein HII31_12893 [Pseudocercospora fuligena]
MLAAGVLALLLHIAFVAASAGPESASTTSDIGQEVHASTSGISAGPTANVGDYIAQGLGATSAALHSLSSPSSGMAVNATSTFSGNATAPAGQYAACQSSWVSWSDAFTKTLSPTVTTITTYDYTIARYNVTYGTADVYTTEDGFPYAHGNLSATSTSSVSLNVTGTSGTVVTITKTNDASFDLPTPDCSIPFDACSTMWQSYLQSLGKPTTIDGATEPAITPVPTNRPRCSVGTPHIIKSKKTWDNKCFIEANSVQVLYWPPSNATTTADSNEVVTTVWSGVTMTSPSVYLSFDSVYAASTSDLDYVSVGTSVPLGATPVPQMGAGGAFRNFVGPSFTNTIIAIAPTEASSVIRNLGPGVNTASALSVIAHASANDTEYIQWVSALSDSGPEPTVDLSYQSTQIDFARMEHPDPTAYYLGLNFAPGCNIYGPHPECSTIFEGAYKPNLYAPDKLRAMAPEWKDCQIPLWGVYDPPIALSKVTTAAGPTLPHGGSAQTGQKTTQPSAALETQKASNTPSQEASTGQQPQQSQQAPQSQQPAQSASNNPIVLGTQTFSIAPPSTENSDPTVPQTATIILGSQTVAIPVGSSPHPSQDGSEQQGTPQIANSPVATLTLGGSAVDVQSPAGSTDPVVIGSVTLSQGGPAATINGVKVSAGSAGIVAGSQTVAYAAPAFTADGQAHTYQANGPNTISIDGTMLSVGGSAATISGQVVSAVSGGVVLGSQTITDLGTAASNSGDAITSLGSGSYAYDSTTFSEGGPAATISGHVVSVGPDGLVVDGTSSESMSAGSTATKTASSRSSNDGTVSTTTTGAAASNTSTSGAEVLRTTWAMLIAATFLAILIVPS